MWCKKQLLIERQFSQPHSAYIFFFTEFIFLFLWILLFQDYREAPILFFTLHFINRSCNFYSVQIYVNHCRISKGIWNGIFGIFRCQYQIYMIWGKSCLVFYIVISFSIQNHLMTSIYYFHFKEKENRITFLSENW